MPLTILAKLHHEVFLLTQLQSYEKKKSVNEVHSIRAREFFYSRFVNVKYDMEKGRG